jgi:hypothetical protein
MKWLLSLLGVFSASVSLAQQPNPSICDRPTGLRDAIVYTLGKSCEAVTAEDLLQITKLHISDIGTLKEQSEIAPVTTFNGLVNVEELHLVMPYGVPELYFAPMTKLRKLSVYMANLADLKIESHLFSGVPELEELEIIFSGYSWTVPQGLFNNLSALKKLRLEGQPYESSIKNNTVAIDGFTSAMLNDLTNLETLEFAFDGVTLVGGMSSDIFKNLSHLKILNLATCSLHLDNRAFSNLKLLNTLDICTEVPQEIDEHLLNNLVNLTALKLRFSTAATIPDTLLTGLKQLKTVDIAADSATSINQNFTRDLLNLKSLSLTFASLDSPQINGLAKLETVQLKSGLYVQEGLKISDKTFSGLPNLIYVYFENLTNLDPKAFVGLPELSMRFLRGFLKWQTYLLPISTSAQGWTSKD